MTKGNKYKELEALVFKRNKDKTNIQRLNKELCYIKKQGSANFFLTAFEIVNDLKEKNVLLGPAKGYANSCLINYILGFTTINPIKYDLICEPYFNLDNPFLDIYVSSKKTISKGRLKYIKNSVFKIELLPILKKYQEGSIKAKYTFNPKKLEKQNWDIDLPKYILMHFYNWEFERHAMVIKDENDLINSMALANHGLKGFHLSNFLHNRHIAFKELASSNKLLLFQEQWIYLVSKVTGKNIDDVCMLKLKMGNGKISLPNFVKLFPKVFDREIINYLFEIRRYLPSKSHTVAEAHILSLSLNFKDKRSKA